MMLDVVCVCVSVQDCTTGHWVNEMEILKQVLSTLISGLTIKNPGIKNP